MLNLILTYFSSWIVPENDIKEHIENSTCDCAPNVEHVNGEIIVIHNSYDKREFKVDLNDIQSAISKALEHNLNSTILSNTQLFIDGYNLGELSIEDLSDMLIKAEKEEEFEIAISLRDAISVINLN